jgi:hypothetical protein
VKATMMLRKTSVKTVCFPPSSDRELGGAHIRTLSWRAFREILQEKNICTLDKSFGFYSATAVR